VSISHPYIPIHPLGGERGERRGSSMEGEVGPLFKVFRPAMCSILFLFLCPAIVNSAPPAFSSTLMSYPIPLSSTIAQSTTSAVLASAAVSSTIPEPTLKISGNRSTTLRYQHYSGLSPAASGFYQSGFTRHETTRLKVSGQALETVKVEGELYQSDVDFDNSYSLKLATKHYELFLGEFPASLEGSEFTLVNRQVQGAKLTGEVPLSPSEMGPPKVDFTIIGSSPRGSTKYEKFFGTDTQGPYQLGSYPVVPNSEFILVDKVKQIRNTDYEINYITGTVTFKKRLVETKSLIEATYEARQTLYPRSLYGASTGLQYSDFDTVRLMAADERDKADSGIASLSGTPPSAHTVLGGSYKHDGEFLRYGGEYGHSFYDPNSLEDGLENGNAYKGSLELERFGVLLGGEAKRVEPNFRALGNSQLGRDFLGWSAHGATGLGKVLRLTGQHQQQRTLMDEGEDRLRTTDAKAELAPGGWPRESYRYYQSDEVYDSAFNRLEKRHTADITHSMKYLTLGGGYERDDIMFRDGSQPDRWWNAGRANMGLTGLSWLNASANGEVRKGREASGTSGETREYQSLLGSTNIGFTPQERYYLGASNNWQKTSGQPAQNTLRTDAKARPIDQLSMEGNFSQETLQMAYFFQQHAARTDSYAAMVEGRPVSSISLLYQPSLRETILSGISSAVNLNRKDGYTAKWALGSFASVEGSFTAEDYRLRDTNDLGLRMQTSQDTDTWNSAIRLAPVPAISMEASYDDKSGSKRQLNTAIPGLYDLRTTHQQTIKTGVKPQLESKFGVDAGYAFDHFRQDGSQGQATSLPGYSISPLAQQIASFSLQNDYTEMHTHEHTVNAGLSYQWLKELISTASLDWDLKQDKLGHVPDTDTLAAGTGLTFRVAAIKLDVNYKLAKSRGGADTQQQALSAGLDWNPDPQVRWSNRAEYSVSLHPTSAATDVTSSLEVSF